MKRTITTALRSALLLSCTLLGCAKSTAPDEGSQTHFLERCEASCPAPYSCLCGVCSLECNDGTSCGEQAEGASCVAPSSSACQEAESICDLECVESAACAALGEGFECIDSRCRQRAPDAGMSDGEVRDAEPTGDAQPDDGLSPIDPWMCMGAHGMALTCDSYDAEEIAATHYDAERGCFEPLAPVEGLCAVPVYCPGGDGDPMCFVSAGGDVYIGMVLWGEELADEGWHHDFGADLDSTLTPAEEDLCSAARSAGQPSDPAVQLGNDIAGTYEYRPACAP